MDYSSETVEDCYADWIFAAAVESVAIVEAGHFSEDMA